MVRGHEQCGDPLQEGDDHAEGQHPDPEAETEVREVTEQCVGRVRDVVKVGSWVVSVRVRGWVQ